MSIVHSSAVIGAFDVFIYFSMRPGQDRWHCIGMYEIWGKLVGQNSLVFRARQSEDRDSCACSTRCTRL